MIGIIGAFDEYGLYGIGPHMPWGKEDGKSALKLDEGRFIAVTKDSAPEGRTNTLVVGRGTAEAMGMRPLAKRRTIILSQTLDERRLNEGLPEGSKLFVARNAQQAVSRALSWSDAGHIFFAGGYEVWLQGLKSGLCTHAFITIVKCNALKRSTFTGEPRYAPEMTLDETFVGMKQPENLPPLEDVWEDRSVELEFRNYMKA